MCVERDGDGGGGSSSRGHQAWTARTGTKRSDEEVKKGEDSGFLCVYLVLGKTPVWERQKSGGGGGDAIE